MKKKMNKFTENPIKAEKSKKSTQMINAYIDLTLIRKLPLSIVRVHERAAGAFGRRRGF